MRLSLLSLALLLVTRVSAAQSPLLITEVIPAPSAGDRIIELTNVSDVTQDVGGWQLCAQFKYYKLPTGMTMAAGASVRVHTGVTGTDTTTDVFTGSFLAPLDPIDEGLGLYIPGGGIGFYDIAANVRDFVQWGAGGQPRVFTAVAAGVWPSTTEFVPAPALGVSLAFDGDGELVGDWFRDQTPTLGEANQTPTAQVAFVGTGCSAGTPPTLGVTSVPAMGNLDFALELEGANPDSPWLLLVGIGLTTVTLPTGCDLHIAPTLLTLGFPSTGPTGDFSLPIVFADDPALPGVEIALQVVADNGPLPGKLDFTNGVGITL